MKVASNSLIAADSFNEGDLVGGSIPQFRAHHRLTQHVVGVLADEASELLKQVPAGQSNIALRTILCDAIVQTAHALDQARSAADLRHVARKLNGVLLSAYQIAEIKPTATPKALLALLRVTKLMVKRCNAEW